MFVKNNRSLMAAMVFLISLLWGNLLAAQEPIATYLSWMRDPTTTMTVSWITEKEDQADVVEVRKNDQEEWMFVLGIHFPFPSEPAYVVHRAEMIGLQPDTEYFFRVGSEGKIYQFRTLPQERAQPLTFAVGGDIYHDEIELVEKTNRIVSQTEPLFVLFGGDLAYAGRTSIFNWEKPVRWIEWMSCNTRSLVTEKGRMIPIVTAVGNHDVNGQYEKSASDALCYFALFPPVDGKSYRVLDFGNYMSVVILDSNHVAPVGGVQKQWLDSTLAERASVPFVCALYHVPAYPGARSFNDKRSKLVRKQWVPLFQRHRLSVAFENHDHCYKRTFPLWDGVSHPDGVLFLGDGAYGVRNLRKPRDVKEAPYLAYAKAIRHFILVTLDDNKQIFQAIDQEGNRFDYVEREPRVLTGY